MSATTSDSDGVFRYQLFGVSLESDEPIPGIAQSAGDGPVVRVRFGPVAETLADPLIRDGPVDATADEYLVSIPGQLRLHVKGTREITVERLSDAPAHLVWSFVLGRGLAVVGLRRGYVPLHAALVAAEDGCIALAGPSGSGKSTVSASLTQLGYRLLADDFCLVQPQPDGPPLAGSGVRETRLWDEAAGLLGWDATTRLGVVPGESKVIYRLADAAPVLLPLKRLYIMGFTDGPPGFERLHGIEALQAVIGVLRLRLPMLSVGPRRQPFESLARLAESVAIYRFVRPCDASQIMAWSLRLVEHLEGTVA